MLKNDEDLVMPKIENMKVDDIPNSATIICLAKRRGGKSTIVEYLMNELYEKGKIDQAYLLSGTDAGFECIDKEHRLKDIEEVEEIIENYKLFNEFNKIADKKDKIKIKTMVILDDLALELKSKKFNILESIATNGRHCAYKPLSLSFVILSQSLTKISRVVRLNTDIIMFNMIASMRELEILFDENMYLLDSSIKGKRLARKVYNETICEDDFMFLCIENYRQNVRTHTDYIKKFKADMNKKRKIKCITSFNG